MRPTRPPSHINKESPTVATQILTTEHDDGSGRARTHRGAIPRKGKDATMETGGVMVSERVKITLDVTAVCEE